jgi:pyruvate/2-oxoglutarate dehydrogenase complex dihydrolipoamide acyltransferase (E2) component
MSIEIRIPGLGAGMTEGTITEWAVPDGAEVSVGDVIYSIETEKTVMDIESTAGGVLKIIGQPGETYEVGALIAHIE